MITSFHSFLNLKCCNLQDFQMKLHLIKSICIEKVVTLIFIERKHKFNRSNHHFPYWMYIKWWAGKKFMLAWPDEMLQSNYLKWEVLLDGSEYFVGNAKFIQYRSDQWIVYLGSNTYISKYMYFESFEIRIKTFVLVFGMFNVHCCKPINFFVCMFNGDLR